MLKLKLPMKPLRWLLNVKIKGMTLIECLVALIVLNLFLLAVPLVLRQGRSMEQQVIGHQEQEWHVFLIQMENKLAEGNFTKISNKAIHFEKEKESKITTGTIEFRANNQLIAIRDNGGYEPILLNVANFIVHQQQQTITFEVYFTNGTSKTGKWTHL